jgi:adenylate kinase family enzyme
MKKIISEYLSFIQEGYILSDKTISVDLHKFEEDTSSGLFILGIAGSGKTTIGKLLSDKYHVIVNSTDECIDIPSTSGYLKCVKKLVMNNSVILEGVGNAEIAVRNNQAWNKIMKSPCIFMGLSVVKSNYRSFMRRYKKNGKLKPFHQLHINNLLLFQKQLNKIRKARINYPNSIVKEL